MLDIVQTWLRHQKSYSTRFPNIFLFEFYIYGPSLGFPKKVWRTFPNGRYSLWCAWDPSVPSQKKKQKLFCGWVFNLFSRHSTCKKCLATTNRNSHRLGLQLTVIDEFLFSTLIVDSVTFKSLGDCLFFIYVYLCTSANIDVQIFLNYYANQT